MIAVLLASPEYCVNKESTPIQLQGMKTFDLLVSRRRAFTGEGVIVVVDHGIDIEHDLGGSGFHKQYGEQFHEDGSEPATFRAGESM